MVAAMASIKSKSRANRSASLILFCSALLPWGPASAGGLAHLATGAEAVAVVEVSFVPYGNLVLLREMLQGDAALLRSPEDFLGECLPPKALVRERAANGGPGAEHYQEALERAGYAAVLVLKRRDGALRPDCEGLQREPLNWDSHPRHAEWLAAPAAAIPSR